MVAGQSLHTFGNPSAHEQAYIEMINRARANPAAEGALLAASTHPGVLDAISNDPGFGVDLSMFQTEMNAIAAGPPLAPHAGLTTAARGHSQWMLDNAQQKHDQPGGMTAGQRMVAVGYNFSIRGENIYSNAHDPEYGHAGFEIDWGPEPGGMQAGRGHRVNIHNSSYREIGVGVVNGSNTVNGNTVGPQLVTQDFGNRFDAPYYGTGVAYYDVDGDNSYDVGEGIAGLTVNVSGASYYCLTADGGGWTVPLPSGTATTRTVTFTGLGINQTANLVVPANSNAKVDLKLPYSPPTFTSPPFARQGQNHTFQFTPMTGATGYNYTSTPLDPAAAENCENLTNATATTSAGYSVVQSTVKFEGTNAWRMTFMNIGGSAYDQFIEQSPVFLGTSTSSMAFRSRLGQATAAAFARIQVKEEGTSTWVNVYSQQGTGSAGEASFQARAASLAIMNGKRFRIRFMFDATGSVNVGAGSGLGWYIDAVTFANVSQLGSTSTGVVATANPTLTAPNSSSWMMQINPIFNGNPLPGTTQTLQVLNGTSFAGWATYHEGQGGLSPGTLTATSDPDKDGRSSALEFAFGSNPVLADTSPSAYPSLYPSATHFILRYKLDTALTGVTVMPQAWAGSGAWYTPGQAGAPAGFTDSLVSTSGTLQTREAKVPLTSLPRCFLRVRATVP
ncbi:MAG: CAP domain-containing protein [Verrucomicrobiales bacterium]